MKVTKEELKQLIETFETQKGWNHHVDIYGYLFECKTFRFSKNPNMAFVKAGGFRENLYFHDSILSDKVYTKEDFINAILEFFNELNNQD